MNELSGKVILSIINRQLEVFEIYMDGKIVDDTLKNNQGMDITTTYGEHKIELKNKKTKRTVYSGDFDLCSRCSVIIKDSLLSGVYIDYVQE